MKLSDYDFDLPQERIAKFPAEDRVSSRLMVVERRSGAISHHRFSDMPELLDKDDFLVLNNTKVVPARLFGKAGSGKVELLLIKEVSAQVFEVFANPAKKLNVGTTITFDREIEAVVLETGERGVRVLKFNSKSDEIFRNGFAPLPPYIKRKHAEASEYRNFDLKRYQTVYSKVPGSIAAPTAGLHFNEKLLNKIRRENEILEITLSVGPATFQKIEVDDIRMHKMGRENISITTKVADRMGYLKKWNSKLVAVGTTTVRSLETHALLKRPGENFESEIFISPGFDFKVVDKLITNFHLPESSLFILVSSFAGLDLMKKAYRIAVENGYNFFSYGDAMFIK